VTRGPHGRDTTSTLDRLKQRGRQFAFTNPLYERGLRGHVPTRLALIPPDPWPGRTDYGQAMLSGIYTICGAPKHLGDRIFSGYAERAPAGWLRALHGFHWLRHLRACGGDQARRRAASGVMQWINTYPRWEPDAWAMDATGARLSHWLSQYEFFAPGLSEDEQAALLESAAMQARHLIRNVGKNAGRYDGPEGAGEVLAIKGWLLFALCTDAHEFRLPLALDTLAAVLREQIAGDGGHVTRNPEEHFGVLRDLIDIRAALVAAQQPVPVYLQDGIDRMVPALRLFRHADGGLATMNGSRVLDPLVIDTALAQADARGRPIKSLPQSGYERIAVGRTTIIVDTGSAATKPYDHNAHAGLFGFELSHGRERIIISCGHDAGEGALFDPLRSTAASSTLVVADTNACEVQPGGGIGRSPTKLASLRESGSYGTRVIMNHNGWQERFNLIYDRTITVSDSGEAIFGEEKLTGTAGHRFTVRFHLSPDVQVSPVQGGALIKPLSGTGWRFQAQGAELDVEESIYLGDGAPRRCYQLVLKGETEDRSALALRGDRRTGAMIGWSLTRERKPARSPDTSEILHL